MYKKILFALILIIVIISEIYSANSSLIILNPIENMDWGNDDEVVPLWASNENIKVDIDSIDIMEA